MSDLIQQLPAKLFNQIAAGEVVQRPASALKELMENSLDAGAKQVTVVLHDAGAGEIHVIDDGYGMNAVDARMCFSQHATSKVYTEEDLHRITTFGFRGEALAAISAVSHVELKTRRHEDEVGTCVDVEKGEILRTSQVQTSAGTHFVIRNLFFNVPARRKFLCSKTTEIRHLTRVFQQMALAHPKVAFTLHVQSAEKPKRTLFQLPAATVQARIPALLGESYTSQIVPIEMEHPALRLYGYIGKPEAAKKRRGEQWLFVNQRYVRSRSMTHAIVRGYESLITPDRHPFFLIFMDIDPLQLDVNIHPAKTEIRFEEESVVYALLQAATKRALGTHHVGSRIDFDLDANFASHMQASDKKEAVTASVQAHKWQAFQQVAALESQYAFEKTDEKTATDAVPPPAATLAQSVIPVPTATPPPLPEQLSTEKLSPPAANQPVQQPTPPFFLLHGRYLGRPVQGRLLIIDCERAYTRMLYERFLKQGDATVAAQRLMFPEVLPFGVVELTLFAEARLFLQKAGFLYVCEQEVLRVHALPVGLKTQEIVPLFEALLEALQQAYEPDLKAPQKAFWSLTAARIAAQQLPLSTETQAQALVAGLYACTQPNYTPKGASILHYIEADTWRRLFVD